MPQINSLSETALTLVSRVSRPLRRLRNLRNEAKFDTQAHQLAKNLPESEDEPWTKSHHPIVSAPASPKRGIRDAVDAGTPSTPPYVDLRDMETPVKNFLLMESFALAMSAKSKRKGRVFLAGDGTEFGELKR